MLNAVPGRTATELAKDAGAALPDLAGELLQAADAFNDVTYGERPGTEPAYRMIADLDRHSAVPRSHDVWVARRVRRRGRLDGGPMTHHRYRRHADGRTTLADRPLGPAGADRRRRRRHSRHLSDGAAARRPDGRCRNLSRRCPRAGHAAARPRRRRDRRRRHRRGRAGCRAEHIGADGADVPPRRRGSAATAGCRTRRPARCRADIADQRDPCAGGSP